jgi:DNA-binding Xre family transcriptional regulator
MAHANMVDRVKVRLHTLGITAAEAARSARLERTFVHDLIAGRKRSITGEALVALAKALGCSPEYLVGTTDTVNANTLTGTPLIGVAEIGAWRAAHIPTASGTVPLASLLTDPSDASALLVRGSGADRIGITDGSIAVIVPHNSQNIALGDVLVIQRKKGSLIETSIRQARAKLGGGIELVAPTSKASDAVPWPFEASDEEITVLGRIVKAVTLFTEHVIHN